jgi:hypothetical protein
MLRLDFDILLLGTAMPIPFHKTIISLGWISPVTYRMSSPTASKTAAEI